MDATQNLMFQALMFTFAIPMLSMLLGQFLFLRRPHTSMMLVLSAAMVLTLGLLSAVYGIVGEFIFPPVESAALLPFWWLIGSILAFFRQKTVLIITTVLMLIVQLVMLYPFLEGIGIQEVVVRTLFFTFAANIMVLSHAFVDSEKDENLNKSRLFSLINHLIKAFVFGILCGAVAILPALLGSLKLAQLSGVAAAAAGALFLALGIKKRFLSTSATSGARFTVLTLLATSSLELEVPLWSTLGLVLSLILFSNLAFAKKLWPQRGEKLLLLGSVVFSVIAIAVAVMPEDASTAEAQPDAYGALY